MTTHKFTEALFERIQRHAVPLVDSLEDVIHRVFDHYEGVGTVVDANGSKEQKAGEKIFLASAVPNLAHATLKTMSVDGIPLLKGVSWNHLMERAIAASAKAGKSPQDILAMMEVPSQVGKSDHYSYTHIPEANISVQGQNSNRAWRQAVRLANTVGFKLEASWAWPNDDKAIMPGVLGRSSVN